MKNAVILFGNNCQIEFGLYNNNTVAMEIMHQGEPYLCATVNWEQNWEGYYEYNKSFPFPSVVLKNYSDNTGIVAELESAGVIEKGGAYLAGTNGTVEARLLTDEWAEIALRQLEAKGLCCQ